MPRNDKYRPDVSLDDVRNYIDEHTRATHYAATIQIEFPPALRQDAKATVQLRPVGAGLSHQPLVQTCGPLPLRAASRQMSALLHLVAQAYAELDTNPWLWAPEKRRQARGEES